MRKRKILLIVFTCIIISVLLTIFLCNKAITESGQGRLYSDVDNVPYNKVGLLLGTSKYIANGNKNLYYAYRMEAAIRLLKSKKVKYIIISGDNGSEFYNEPKLMRADLIRAGIDTNRIILDYAGFRTFDSIKRLKEIFGQHSATIISQQFHNERAIFIAGKEGISAIGYNARDLKAGLGWKVKLRERLARVKVFVDLMLGTKPKFLGDKISIPA